MTVGRAFCALACGIATALYHAPSQAQTLAERFQTSLSALKRPGKLDRAHGGALLHWHLTEAQTLVANIRGGAEALEQVATGLVATSKVPWLQGEALGALASLLYVDEPDKARAALRQAGVIDRAWVLGPLPSPGTQRAGMPGETLDLATTVAGVNAPVRWRWVEDAALTGAFQLADVLDADGDVHAWVVVALHVAKPTDGMVLVSSNGPLRASLNGRLLTEWDGERALTDWQNAFPVRFAPGRHHLAIRVGHRTHAPELLMRVVDRNGRLPAGITVVKADTSSDFAAHAQSARLPSPLGALAGEAPEVSGRLLLHIRRTPDARREAAVRLEQAIAKRPEDPELHYLLGRAERADSDRARAAFERALVLSKDTHAAALGHLLELTERARLVILADDLARRLYRLDPQHSGVLAYKARRLAELSDAGAALAWLKRQTFHPDQPDLVWVQADLAERSGRRAQAAKGWERLSRLLGGRLMPMVRAVKLARRQGRSDLATVWLAHATRQRGWAVWPQLLTARLLHVNAGRTRPALALIDRWLQRQPSSAELFELKGEILLEDGDKKAAIAAFDRALELKPQHQKLASRRRGLVSQRSLADRFASPLDAVVATSKDVPSSDTGAMYLLDKQVVKVHDNGLSSRFTQRVIRVDSDGATSRLEAMAFRFTPGQERFQVVEAEVLHSDGSRSRPKAVETRRPSGKTNGVYTLDARRVIRFSNLRKGDVIHVQVTSDEIGERNLFGSFFGVFFPVQGGDPKHRVIRAVDAPQSRKLFTHGEGIGKPERTVDAKTGRQRISWTVSGVPAIRLEQKMPGYGDIASYASISTYDSWGALADWYRELVTPQLTLSPRLQTLARQLVAKATTTQQKVAAVQNWVVKHTRYVGIEFGIHGFKPYKVTQVVDRGYGDCKDKASLLIALLAEVGITAEFVLVRTRDLGRLAPRPATLWAFNHAIAYVPELDTYIDATSEFAGLGEVPALDQGAMILRIDMADVAKSPVLTRLPFRPAAENLSTSLFTVRLAEDGSARMEAQEDITGTQTPRLRRHFSDASLRTQRLAALVGASFPGAVLSQTRFSGLDVLGSPLQITYAAYVPGFAQVQGNIMEVPMDPKPNLIVDRFGRYGRRSQVLVLDHPATDRTIRRFVLPQGATAAKLPDAVVIASAFGRYASSTTSSKDVVTWKEELVLSATDVMPSDYPKFRQFVEAVAAARGAAAKIQLAPSP